MEEDHPRAHDLIGEWLADFSSALLIYDNDAGYRSFLGGDSVTGAALSAGCDEIVEFNGSFVSSEDLAQLSKSLVSAIRNETIPSIDTNHTLEFILSHFYPEMLDEIVRRVKSLI